MDNQSHRSFRPDPTPRRADGLKGRMRSATPGRPQPSNTKRTTPPNGEFVPPASSANTVPAPVNVYESDSPQHRLNDQPEQPEPSKLRSSYDDFINSIANLNLKSYLPSNISASELKKTKLKIPKINQKYVLPSVIAIAAVFLISVVGFGLYYVEDVQTSKNPTIPVALTKQTGYRVLYPSKNDAAKIDKSTFKFDDKDKLLSYVGYTPNKNKLIISQQAQPDTMKAGQPAYDLLMSRMLRYKTFKTTIGEVSLTRPAQFQGDQFAVLKTKDSLLFVRPGKDISDNQWKDIFNSFKPID